MKKMLTIICFSCIWTFTHGKQKSILCGDDVSVIQKNFNISFGDTITAGVATELSLPISWRVSPQAGVNKSFGSGKTTNDLIFSHPGKYEIIFDIPAHGDHPAKTETVIVEVSNVRMYFDTKNIELSKQLTSGDVSGIVLTVPVDVKIYDGGVYNYTMREVKTTGVANVSSRLKDSNVVLKNGLNKLTFELSGTISQQGSIQFRVYDEKGNATFFNQLIN